MGTESRQKEEAEKAEYVSKMEQMVRSGASEEELAKVRSTLLHCGCSLFVRQRCRARAAAAALLWRALRGLWAGPAVRAAVSLGAGGANAAAHSNHQDVPVVATAGRRLFQRGAARGALPTATPCRLGIVALTRGAGGPAGRQHMDDRVAPPGADGRAEGADQAAPVPRAKHRACSRVLTRPLVVAHSAGIRKRVGELRAAVKLVRDLQQCSLHKNKSMDEDMAGLQQILTAKQAAKFLLWVDQNAACMNMLNKLWASVAQAPPAEVPGAAAGSSAEVAGPSASAPAAAAAAAVPFPGIMSRFSSAGMSAMSLSDSDSSDESVSPSASEHTSEPRRRASRA